MVFVAVPHQGELCTGLVRKLIEFDKRDDVELFFNQARPVDVNRCEIAHEFLETDHEWLVMVDSDLIPPDDVLELTDTDADIISPIVFSSNEGVPYPVATVLNSDDELVMYGDETDDRIQADGLGTGCIFIRRQVFDELDKPYFTYRKHDDGTMKTGEDFDFSLRCKEEGLDLVVDTTKVAGHISSTNLRRYMENMATALDANADSLGRNKVEL